MRKLSSPVWRAHVRLFFFRCVNVHIRAATAECGWYTYARNTTHHIHPEIYAGVQMCVLLLRMIVAVVRDEVPPLRSCLTPPPPPLLKPSLLFALIYMTWMEVEKRRAGPISPKFEANLIWATVPVTFCN